MTDIYKVVADHIARQDKERQTLVCALYISLYESWFNDFLSLACFAEHHLLSERQAGLAIRKGRVLRETNLGTITDLAAKHH